MQSRFPTSRGQRLARTARKFVQNAVQRRLSPEKFIKNDLTPYEELHRDGIFALRHYLPLTERTISVEGIPELPVSQTRVREPLVLVPPLGVHTWIFDLLHDRSLVRYFLARGFDVYLLDWGAPGPDDHDLSLDTYVNRWLPRAMSVVREHSGQQDVSMVGYCMGGLFSLMYIAASGDAHVTKLATIASPVDFHGGGGAGKIAGVLSVPAMMLHRWAELSLSQVREQRFHMPGWVLSVAFRATNPPGSLIAYLDMVRHLADTEYVTEYMSMGQWFNDMPYFPGSVVREITEKFWIANQLSRGKLRVGEAKLDFADVRCPLLAFAGDDDRIVDVAAARHVLDVIGSTDKTFRVGPGGHAGVFAGSRAPAEVWRPIADFLMKAGRQATTASERRPA